MDWKWINKIATHEQRLEFTCLMLRRIHRNERLIHRLGERTTRLLLHPPAPVRYAVTVSLVSLVSLLFLPPSPASMFVALHCGVFFALGMSLARPPAVFVLRRL